MLSDYQDLKDHLASLQGVVVAFSGGVDSSLLLAAAHDALGDQALAVSADSPTYPRSEFRAARSFAAELGARHLVVKTGEMENSCFTSNPGNRCYFCKHTLFTTLQDIARQEGLPWIVEGSNLDDLDDHRPGIDAARKLGVRSPFLELGIGKTAIRKLARIRGLRVWSKAASACLASRIPFGDEITEARLKRIERAEEFLRSAGFRQARARDHGPMVRVEVAPDEINRLVCGDLRRRLVAELKAAGYIYISLDLEGYRSGAMNEESGKCSPTGSAP